jgi:anti-sigma B factor antagonist
MSENETFVDEVRQGVTVVHSMNDQLIDPSLADDLTSHLCGLLESGSMCLLIDLNGVTRLSSVFIRSFIAAGKMAQKTKASVSFCNIPSNIKEIFEITGLDKLFQFFETEADGFSELAR